MKLFGSTTSPYVRRLRMVLDGKDYEFCPFNIFGKDREKIKETNPILKVPFFEDEQDGKVVQIFDSGNIYRYLADKFQIPSLTIEQQNLISIIDACCDSLVNMMILTRSKVDVSQDKLYFNIQRERQAASFAYLDKAVKDGQFSDWSYCNIALIATIEWAMFRQLFDFSPYHNLLQFIEEAQSNPVVVATQPKE